MPRRARLAAVALLIAVVLAAGCSNGGSETQLPSGASTEEPPLLMTLGNGGTESDVLRDPLREGWPYVLLRTGLPLGATLVNTDDGINQLIHGFPEALELISELKPDVVAVWLGITDYKGGQPPDDFRANLTELLRAIHANGGARVLVANLPRVLDIDVGDYNTAIAAAARAANAELVDISELPTLNAGPNRDEPDVAGHEAIAAAFAAAVTRVDAAATK